MPDAAGAARLGAAIGELTRALAAGGPAPRGLACFGLESASGTAAALLDGLGSHGIFRKYELVLVLDDRLGGSGRWLAARLGCRAVSTAAAPATAAAGRALTRRAGLGARVEHVPAAAGALPFRDAAFTHVWIVESLPRIADPVAALREAHRVLRPGGHLSLQELVRAGDAPLEAPAGFCVATLSERLRTLRAAGFDEVVVRDVTSHAGERSARVVAARQRLHARLAASDDRAFAAEAVIRRRLAEALAGGTLRVVQGFARRP